MISIQDLTYVMYQTFFNTFEADLHDIFKLAFKEGNNT